MDTELEQQAARSLQALHEQAQAACSDPEARVGLQGRLGQLLLELEHLHESVSSSPYCGDEVTQEARDLVLEAIANHHASLSALHGGLDAAHPQAELPALLEALSHSDAHLRALLTAAQDARRSRLEEAGGARSCVRCSAPLQQGRSSCGQCGAAVPQLSQIEPELDVTTASSLGTAPPPAAAQPPEPTFVDDLRLLIASEHASSEAARDYLDQLGSRLLQSRRELEELEQAGQGEASSPGLAGHLAPDEGVRIRRLAVLVLSETLGAAVREVEAPAR